MLAPADHKSRDFSRAAKQAPGCFSSLPPSVAAGLRLRLRYIRRASPSLTPAMKASEKQPASPMRHGQSRAPDGSLAGCGNLDALDELRSLRKDLVLTLRRPVVEIPAKLCQVDAANPG